MKRKIAHQQTTDPLAQLPTWSLLQPARNQQTRTRRKDTRLLPTYHPFNRLILCFETTNATMAYALMKIMKINVQTPAWHSTNSNLPRSWSNLVASSPRLNSHFPMSPSWRLSPNFWSYLVGWFSNVLFLFLFFISHTFQNTVTR